MKKTALALLASLVMATGSMMGQDIFGKLSDLAGKATGNSSAASVVGELLGKTNVDPKDLVGTWSYVSPAVQFKSDDLLKKAGGAAAAATVEEKLAPYYEKAGLTSMTLTMNDDGTFAMKAKRATLSGTYTKGDDGNYVFQFKAVKKMNIGKMTAYITKAGSQIKLTFDASKLISLVEKVSAVSGNTSLKAASSMLSSYDGMNCGFTLRKQ